MRKKSKHKDRYFERKRKAKNAFWGDKTITLPKVNLANLPKNISSLEQLQQYISFLHSKPEFIPEFVKRISSRFTDCRVKDTFIEIVTDIYNSSGISTRRKYTIKEKKVSGGGICGSDVSLRQCDEGFHYNNNHMNNIPRNHSTTQYAYEYGMTDT